MTSYVAPLRDMQFVLQELAGLDQINELPGCEEVTPDLVESILEEAAKFAGEILAPLNRIGDTQGAKWRDGNVITPVGFREAYKQFVEAGWQALALAQEYGGQGLPKTVAAPVMEMWHAANKAWSMCPFLTQGAIEALLLCGSAEQKQRYLPKMVSGEWSGTMNLTEPQAGSDLAAVRTKAVPQGDGAYRLYGQKIFISFGEHDFTDNIIHLVLARTPDAPEGMKGISLFIAPKFMVRDDGRLGERNDVHCVSIEHKLGIHGSPTCVLAYGDQQGAIGYLVGQENRGIEYMFIMMNEARFMVGMEGMAIAERAYQQALNYARERIQGKDASQREGKVVPIIRHPDVRRMLMLMKSQVEAMRALAYVTAAAIDTAHRHPSAAERARRQALIDLLIPILKGWNTETGIEIASLGIQVHGGMGFIEGTGATQYLRDVRIASIYEGTTGIQASDLIGRKIARENGATARALIETMRALEAPLAALPNDDFKAIGARLGAGVDAFAESVEWIINTYPSDIKAALAGAVPFLKLAGIVCGGWQMARAALAAANKLKAGDGDAGFYQAKIATAWFYADHVLTQAPGLRDTVVLGAAGVLALAEEQF